ncbi:MAG TPA: NAD-dependent DNA ligase LigA [Desulfobacterales bacterium]
MAFKKNPSTDFKPVDALDKDEARRQIEALREGIDYHDYRYYVKNDPVISDAVYDKLFKRLRELEEAYPQFQSDNSPTRRVGAEPVDELKKVEHSAVMLSLNASLEKKEVRNFFDFVIRNADRKDVEFVLEPKFDGFSVEIVYEEGRFKYGATRGDGKTGEDISANLKTIGAVPLRLRKQDGLPGFVAVRGEVFMPKDGFQQLNQRRIENGREPFANPRNAAAGSMRQLDPGNVADKPFDILFYEVLKIEAAQLKTHWETLRRMAQWGLKTDSRSRRCTKLSEVADFHRRLDQSRDDLDYEIDGVVIKVDDLQLRERLGTRQCSPRWAFAWKFPPKQEVTILEKIVVQVGRTGKLTPVALLQPVDVGGVTVSRATLHNEDEVLEKDVRPGDKVRIARAGDVIPEVVERIKTPGRKRSEKFSMPQQCPSCGSEIVREGAYHFCPAGLACRPQLVGGILHYGSREALNIEGLGEKTAADLVNKEFFKDFADLYRLSEDDLRHLEGFAEKSARQLHEAIQKSKKPHLDRFLYALGIRHVGQRTARILAEQFRTLDALKEAGKEDLERISDIGPEIARSIADFFAREKNRAVLDRLADSGVEVQPMPAGKKAQPLQGTTFVFTGSLADYTRQEAKRAVEDRGARATSSISGETDYLVVGENPGSKRDEAEAQDVEILDENGFKDLIGD